MSSPTDESDLHSGDWFRCPRCGEGNTDKFRTKVFLAFGNASVKLECGACGYHHTERDPKSPNWRRGIRWRLFFTAQALTHPQASREIHQAARCPYCSGTSVVVTLQSEDVSPDHERGHEYETVLGLSCENCEEGHETRVGHA